MEINCCSWLRLSLFDRIYHNVQFVSIPDEICRQALVEIIGGILQVFVNSSKYKLVNMLVN